MRGGFRTALHPPQRVSEVELDRSRPAREQLCEEIRLRAHLAQLLTATLPGDGLVCIEAVGALADLSV